MKFIKISEGSAYFRSNHYKKVTQQTSCTIQCSFQKEEFNLQQLGIGEQSFQANVPFLYPMITDFLLMILERIDLEQLFEMG